MGIKGAILGVTMGLTVASSGDAAWAQDAKPTETMDNEPKSGQLIPEDSVLTADELESRSSRFTFNYPTYFHWVAALQEDGRIGDKALTVEDYISFDPNDPSNRLNLWLGIELPTDILHFIKNNTYVGDPAYVGIPPEGVYQIAKAYSLLEEGEQLGFTGLQYFNLTDSGEVVNSFIPIDVTIIKNDYAVPFKVQMQNETAQLTLMQDGITMPVFHNEDIPGPQFPYNGATAFLAGNTYSLDSAGNMIFHGSGRSQDEVTSQDEVPNWPINPYYGVNDIVTNLLVNRRGTCGFLSRNEGDKVYNFVVVDETSGLSPSRGQICVYNRRTGVRQDLPGTFEGFRFGDENVRPGSVFERMFAAERESGQSPPANIELLKNRTTLHLNFPIQIFPGRVIEEFPVDYAQNSVGIVMTGVEADYEQDTAAEDGGGTLPIVPIAGAVLMALGASLGAGWQFGGGKEWWADRKLQNEQIPETTLNQWIGFINHVSNEEALETLNEVVKSEEIINEIRNEIKRNPYFEQQIINEISQRLNNALAQAYEDQIPEDLIAEMRDRLELHDENLRRIKNYDGNKVGRGTGHGNVFRREVVKHFQYLASMIIHQNTIVKRGIKQTDQTDMTMAEEELNRLLAQYKREWVDELDEVGIEFRNNIIASPDKVNARITDVVPVVLTRRKNLAEDTSVIEFTNGGRGRRYVPRKRRSVALEEASSDQDWISEMSMNDAIDFASNTIVSMLNGGFDLNEFTELQDKLKKVDGIFGVAGSGQYLEPLREIFKGLINENPRLFNAEDLTRHQLTDKADKVFNTFYEYLVEDYAKTSGKGVIGREGFKTEALNIMIQQLNEIRSQYKNNKELEFFIDYSGLYRGDAQNTVVREHIWPIYVRNKSTGEKQLYQYGFAATQK